jgi:protein-disulfide isomerase
MPILTRLLSAALALFLAASVIQPASAAPAGDGEMRLGDPRAKVTVIEYASVVCPHCAAFNADTFPAFKAKYVDTGKVLYVFREFPTEPVEVAVAGFLVARCAPADRYFAVIDALFRGQEKLFESRNGRQFLIDAAKAGGLGEAQVEQCLKDEGRLAALQSRVNTALEVEKIDATPTFVIGQTRLKGAQSLEALSAAIDPLLAAR